jgi:hypothetical protein
MPANLEPTCLEEQHPVILTAEEKRIAIKATKAMDLKVAGVVIIRSAKNHYYWKQFILGLEGIERPTNKILPAK